MENCKFDEFTRIEETLIPDNSSSGVLDWEKKDPPEIHQQDVMVETTLIEEFKDSQMNDFQEFSGDSMVCDPSSKLVPNGFSRSCCTEDIVTFVNAGCEASSQAESGVEFSADDKYLGGDVTKTDECIIEAGDYPFVYQSARFGNFSYQFNNLPPGDYFVDLHFAEIMYTYGPRGMRVFNVVIQDEKVLSDFDIFAVAGANKPLRLVDCRVTVKEDGMILIRFEGVSGSPIVSGICIRKAPKLADSQVKHEVFRCQNCAAEIEVLAQEKGLRPKSTAKYEKKIEELSQQCQRKTDECYQAWMSLTAANEQLEKVRMELDNRVFKSYSLDQTVEKQAESLKAISSRYEQDKKFWMTAISGLEEKIKNMKEEHSQLAHDAHETADSIPELSNMVSAVQMLVAQCEEFKQKYIEEQKKRKKLFNEVQEAKGNIRVFCRCRPLSKKEQTAGYATVVDFEGAKDGELAILNGGSNKKMFKFDRVYTPKDDQADVFMDASPMATSVLDGYNVCIFAYGQTGTGKTFTMEGTEQNRGVNYRTLEMLFKIAKERSDTYTYDLSVSVLEVYNEQIRDLLGSSPTSKKLEIKQASEGSHHVPGLVEAKVENTKQVWEVLRAGSNARAVGSNNVNEHSSRSHCMLSIMVKAKNLINGESTKSKLWLVDLAGSERLAKTDVQGERLKEAQNINRSLSALGDVISALANKSSHIPYRNSKLTHLLQDSLGGDSKTLMFVQISPSEHDLGETLSSLNFASRVRGVELAPARRQIDTSELQKTKMLLDKARQESKSKEESIRKLEEILQNIESKARSKDQTNKNQQDKIRDLEEQLGLKATSHSQSEKQLLQLQEKLKGREETCSVLQHKVKELEDKLREQQFNDSAALQQARDLEKKLKEQVHEYEVHSLALQHKIKELEQKIEHERNTKSNSLHQKIKELEQKLKDQERQLEQRVLQPLDHAEVPGATPVAGRPSLRDETMIEADPFVLRSSNSSNRMSHGSTMSRRSDIPTETRRKRGFRSGETENQIPAPAPFHDKKIRKSDPPKPISRVTKTTRPVAAPPQRPLVHSRITREKDTKEKVVAKKRIWN
ncbi:kinesin-like protein KIN-14R [Chenopodium quinoa]|uniref:kinesin-like protein KIN-14R n=1 Tax=Chenopodium quinoa TaxID=63459 RepID=UPI000B7878CD|nr:kinesin-like protein KIN-14R [Chenopodium quinoa]